MVPVSSVYSTFPPVPQGLAHPETPSPQFGDLIHYSPIGSSPFTPAPQEPETPSPQRSNLITYSPIGSFGQAETFSPGFTSSRPASFLAREAQRQAFYGMPRVEQTALTLSEGSLYDSNSEVQATAFTTPTHDLDQFFEPTPARVSFVTIDGVFAFPQDPEFQAPVTPAQELEDEDTEDAASRAVLRAVSTGTVLLHRRSEDRERVRRQSLVLRQVRQHTPEAVMRPSPRQAVQIVAEGPTRVMQGFDLFVELEQEVSVEGATESESLFSSDGNSRSTPPTAWSNFPQPRSDHTTLYRMLPRSCVRHMRRLSKVSPPFRSSSSLEAIRILLLARSASRSPKFAEWL
jgi:hypothetical protein